MLKKERQKHILDTVKSRKYCTVNYLSAQLFVAPITIRRDLKEMESAGLITRCYGGAAVPEYENREVPFSVRNKSNSPAKAEIAKRAAKFIKEGDVVFLDASSTVSYITDYIYPEQNLTIITNSTLVAERLKEKHVRCYLTGGITIDNSYALSGSVAEKIAADFYANVCFFSTQGVDEFGVISDYSESETALRRIMIANSEKAYFLFDSSKYKKRLAFKICKVSDVAGYITDSREITF